MQNHKRAVQSAARAGHATRNKPVAPADIWDELEQLHAAASQITVRPKPAGAFTAREYCAKFNVNLRTAQKLLKKMQDEGKVNRYSGGTGAYYLLASKTTL